MHARRIHLAAGARARPPLKSCHADCTKRGTCNAIIWWFDLHLDDEQTLPAGPGAAVRTWKQNVFHVEPGVKVIPPTLWRLPLQPSGRTSPAHFCIEIAIP